MKDLIIIGNASYARMMKNYIQLTNFGHVCAYAVEAEYITSPVMDGVSVIPLENLADYYPCQAAELIMGIGYTKMGQVRKRIFEQCKEAGYTFANYIHPTAILPPDIPIGEGNNILEGVIVEAGVTIGNANLFFGGSMIGHESEIGSYNTFSVRATTAGCVTVGNHCFLGVSSAVKDHVVLSDYVLLGAMAYAFKNMEEYSVVVPAKSEILENKKSIDYL